MVPKNSRNPKAVLKNFAQKGGGFAGEPLRSEAMLRCAAQQSSAFRTLKDGKKDNGGFGSRAPGFRGRGADHGAVASAQRKEPRAQGSAERRAARCLEKGARDLGVDQKVQWTWGVSIRETTKGLTFTWEKFMGPGI